MGQTVRKASLKDAESILHVINASNREAFSKIIPKEYFKEPILSMKELLRDFKRMAFYVFEGDRVVVGVSALKVEGDVGRIRWVYVLPEHQRKGIGTALIRNIEKEAKEIDLKKLWLLTSEKAYWAVNFYKKHGYKLVDRIKRPYGYDVIMEKEML